MRTLLLSVLFSSLLTGAFAQQIKLTDTVMYINDKATAYYFTELHKASQQYNVDVYSLADQYLIKAEVVKFTAPVRELKSFYYYELSFPSVPDTFMVTITDEAFPIVLAKMIRDYKLIFNDKISVHGLANLKAGYAGGTALQAKIQEQMNFLNGSRHFDEQVIRDRTKPVTIINDRVIMQDGKKIGTIQEIENLAVTNQTIQIQALGYESDFNILKAYRALILFANGRRIDYNTEFSPLDMTLTKGQPGYTLYMNSRTKDIAPRSYKDQLLIRICYYIEDYAL